jgi:hypothetical protein
MNKRLRNDLEALWQEILPKLSWLEKKGISGRKELVFGLVDKYIGPTYDERDELKEATNAGVA